jgi:hypothetical protein
LKERNRLLKLGVKGKKTSVLTELTGIPRLLEYGKLDDKYFIVMSLHGRDVS